MTQSLLKSRLLASAPEQLQPDFEAQHTEFVSIAQSILYNDIGYLAIVQSLVEALGLLEESLASKKEPCLRQYLRRAARKLTLYIRQNDLRLTNPELFTPLQPVAHD